MADNLLAAVHVILYVLLALVQFCQGQICKYHHLHADCYYRIDAICLSHITIDINQCDDPISLNLSIECKNPVVDWKATFSRDVERRMVGGFDKEVFITVQQGYTDTKQYRINIDFISEKLGKVHFMDEKLDLITEGCATLNGAAKVAVGVLVPLLVLSIIALVVIIIIRKRQLRKHQLTRAMLVNNLDGPGFSEAPVQSDIGEVTDAAQDSSSSNSVANGDAVVFSQLPETHIVNENPTC